MKKITIISNYISLALILSILSYFAFSGANAKDIANKQGEKTLVRR